VQGSDGNGVQGRRSPSAAGVKIVREGANSLESDEGSFHLDEKRLRLGGRQHLIAAAMEQGETELGLEIANETADRRLSDMHPVGADRRNQFGRDNRRSGRAMQTNSSGVGRNAHAGCENDTAPSHRLKIPR
jgi:hypothetical protein